MTDAKYTKVDFNEGDVLSIEMLTALYESPDRYIRCMYSGWERGIISGFDVQVADGIVYLLPGIVNDGEHLYSMTDRINISELINGLEKDAIMDVCIVRAEDKKRGAISNSYLKLNVAPKGEITDGIKLMTIYKDAQLPEDLNKLKQDYRITINLWECDYVYNGKKAIHPYVASLIYKALINKRSCDMDDAAFIYQLCNNYTITHEAFEFYCCRKIKNVHDEDVLNIQNYLGEKRFEHLLRAFDEPDVVAEEPKEDNNVGRWKMN